MPRRERFRKIVNPPHFRGYTPIGLPETKGVVTLNFEEYEAIRLCDFDFYDHLEASRIMDVSRPTFARIYDKARQKVAYAFVQGLPIIFQGGRVYYDSDWYICNTCGSRFDHVDKEQPVEACALCGSEKIKPVEEESTHPGHAHVCICPACGHEKLVRFGIPCSHVICDKCNSRMRRKRDVSE